MRRVALLALIAGSLAGCSALPDWWAASDKPPLPGDRISVLALEKALEPDPRIADLQVRLPRPWPNPDWPQPGGYPSHAMQHLALGDATTTLWRADIGASSDSEERIVAPPVVAGNHVFAMDARSTVTAFDAQTGTRRWRVDLTPRGEDHGAIGGGVTFDSGRLYATTAYGEVVALEAETGKVLWRRALTSPFRAPPTVGANRVFAVGSDSQLHVLAGDSGETIWTHVGIQEAAGLLGAAGPAVDGGMVVVPFSSGELYGLRADNGVVAWNDALIRTGRVSPVGLINDITGLPVIDRGRVFAIGHAGRMVAIDLRTGERVWEQEIAGLQSPWVAGDFVYVVTLDAELICMSQRDGRVRWVRQLDRYRDPNSRSDKGRVVWYGPVLGGDRLVLASSQGEAISVSPYTGEVLGRMKLSGAAATAPVIANGILYLLTTDARLLALK